jgi:hypothetical protein
LIQTGIEDEINKNAPQFQRETMARIERAYCHSSSSFSNASNTVSRAAEIAGHLVDSAAQYLIIPLFSVDEFGHVKADAAPALPKKRGRAENSSTAVSSFTFTKLVYLQLTSVPAELDASKRASLISSVKACEAAEVELQSFGQKHSADIRNLNHAFVQIED